jgi:hypothetical protein
MIPPTDQQLLIRSGYPFNIVTKIFQHSHGPIVMDNYGIYILLTGGQQTEG